MFTTPLDQEKIDKLAAEYRRGTIDDPQLCSATSDPERNRRNLFDTCVHVGIAREHAWELYLDGAAYPERIREAVAIIDADVDRCVAAAGLAVPAGPSCPWVTRGTVDCAEHGPADCDGARCGVAREAVTA